MSVEFPNFQTIATLTVSRVMDGFDRFLQLRQTISVEVQRLQQLRKKLGKLRSTRDSSYCAMWIVRSSERRHALLLYNHRTMETGLYTVCFHCVDVLH